MALKKPVSDSSGFTAEYHQIYSVRDNPKIPEVTVFVNVFKDAQNKVKPLIKKSYAFHNQPIGYGENEEPIYGPVYFLEPENVNPENRNHIERAYEALKLLPEFDGYENV